MRTFQSRAVGKDTFKAPGSAVQCASGSQCKGYHARTTFPQSSTLQNTTHAIGSEASTALPIQLQRKKKGKFASKKDKAAREGAREAKYSSTVGGGTTIFHNEEGRLPKAPKGQHYIETDVGRGRENRGKRRVVSLVESTTGRVVKQYNTEDHYGTFT